MFGYAAVVTVLSVFTVSVLVVRAGTVALVMTGLSRDVARFQALSAYTGTGFTTNEAEQVVDSPERRRVVETLTRVGSVGLVTGVSTVVISFANSSSSEGLGHLAVLVVGFLLLVALLRSDAFDRVLTPFFERLLERTTSLTLRDYTNLLHLRGDYRVAELPVLPEGWLAGERLADLALPEEGVIVLAVAHGSDDGDGEYEGAPNGDVRLSPGDRLLAYGREDRLDELTNREAGDVSARASAVREHENADAGDDGGHDAGIDEDDSDR